MCLRDFGDFGDSKTSSVLAKHKRIKVEEGNVVLDLPPNLGPAIARAYQAGEVREAMKTFEVNMHSTSWYKILSEIFLKWILFFFNFGFSKSYGGGQFCLGGGNNDILQPGAPHCFGC